ncbi:MAG: hypothetical protein Fur0043_05120 [Anaerolineales bacterium]
MKNKGCLRWSVVLGSLALAVLCIAAISLAYFQARARAFHSRPLVLIHAPLNHDQARVGESILLHATARADNGLRRIELWADGVFVEARDAAGSPTQFVFAGSWTPTGEGSHTLVVRAVASDGTEGQATVTVEALLPASLSAATESGAEAPAVEGGTGGESGEPPVVEGASGEEGSEPAAAEGEPPASDEAPSVPAGEDPPAPEGAPPGVLPGVLPWDSPLFEPLHLVPFRPGEPLGLRVEFLGLGTAAAYEQLHCYVGYGDTPPRWFPDSDGDQTTDESFEIVGVGAGGETIWNLAPLSGESMPAFPWPRATPLPVNVSCVGIVGGGTDAVELGRWEDNIEPERWTGIPIAGGAAGMYEFAFRITRVGIWESDETLETDFDMTPPTNLRIQQSDSTLRWDYLPRPDEARIHGFRVYLNGSLQWVEPSEARASALPPEWIHPPCGTTYRFDVTAYRLRAGGIEESTPAAAFLEQSAADCERQVAITFVSLETFDLPGDGDAGDRTGDIGPAYGFFWANDQQVTFNGGHLGRGLDLPFGLSRNTTYSINDMASHGWNFSGEPLLVVPVPDGGAFQFGFHIEDEDSGRCRHSDDPGCDDLICEGFSDVYEEAAVSDALDSHHEETLTSEDGRCRLTVQWGPAAGSPVGSGLEGWEPAPWIRLEKMRVDESGVVRLDIRNTGTAAWPGRDLNIELQSREGVSLGVFTWPGFTLEAGQRTTLEHPDMRLAAPFDACVMIDPYNDVAEEYERSGGLWHFPVCPPLPDLVIPRVTFDPAGGGRIRVEVQNVGEGALEDRTLAFTTLLPDGSPLYMAASWPHVTLEPGASRMFDLSGVTESTLARMAGGYTVIVNPENAIRESSAANNAFAVGHTVRVRIEPLEFYSGRAGENQLQCETEVYFRILLGHGASRDDVEWTEMRYPHSGHLTYRTDVCGEPRPGPWIPDSSYYFEIEIPSTENLYLFIDGWEIDDPGEDDNLGAIDMVFGPAENFGEGVYGWTWSVGGYNNDLRPNGGHNFQARWRIVIVTP